MVKSSQTIAVIIPVHNGGSIFDRCLSSVRALEPAPDEVIVVADGDSDGSGKKAEDAGARVFYTKAAGGPAKARNIGAGMTEAEILFFVDSDVALPRDAVRTVLTAFEKRPDIKAVFGSYDESPSESNFLSQYKNIFHHYVHQHSKEEASTFWGASGAVRRDVFTQMGGFDENFSTPMIEDIELGYRIKGAGHRILLDKDLQVKHLKHWGVLSLLKADFFCRALPWTKLILENRSVINDLNLQINDRISTVIVYLWILSLGAAFLFPWLLGFTVISVILLLQLNSELYRFFHEKKGVLFLLRAIPWHWFYFFYSGLAFAIGFFKFYIGKIFRNKFPGAKS